MYSLTVAMPGHTQSMRPSYLPALCHQLDTHHRHRRALHQPCLLQCVIWLEHPPPAERTLPGPTESRQLGEAVLRRPAAVCSHLFCGCFWVLTRVCGVWMDQ